MTWGILFVLFFYATHALLVNHDYWKRLVTSRPRGSFRKCIHSLSLYEPVSWKPHCAFRCKICIEKKKARKTHLTLSGQLICFAKINQARVTLPSLPTVITCDRAMRRLFLLCSPCKALLFWALLVEMKWIHFQVTLFAMDCIFGVCIHSL